MRDVDSLALKNDETRGAHRTPATARGWGAAPRARKKMINSRTYLTIAPHAHTDTQSDVIYGALHTVRVAVYVCQ